jgi:hypothetical protein
MSERLRSMTDDELGAALAGLDLAWPSTPEMAPSVMASTRGPAPRVTRLPLPRSRRILLIAAAIVLLLAGAAVAAKIVFDIGAVVVTVEPDPRTDPSPTPGVAEPFGEPITSAEAARLLGADLALPSALGPPDRLWADEVFTEAGEVVRITAAWEPNPALPAIEGSRFGAVLMRFEGDADQAFKDVYEETGVVEQAFVDGREATWTSGPHLLHVLTGDGMVDLPVEGHVLLWRDGDYTMRLETAVSKGTAERIAGTTGTP